MKKLTLQEKLHSRKLKKAPFGLYNLLGRIWLLLFFKKYHIDIKYNCDIKKNKGPHILISNHASRIDYVFNALCLLPNRYNFVVGYNEFFRGHLAPILKMCQCVPKQNFTPDFYTIREVNRIFKQGGRIIIFPEGMSSISGANQPVAIGTGKFIKHYKLPVYYSVIKGGYLTSPKYNLIERLGHVEVEYNTLFTPEELETLTPEDIEDKINKAIYHDDYKWNLEKKYKFKTKGEVATNLHHLLYHCPKCHKDLVMKAKGNLIKCTNCGNGATIDDTYKMTPLNETCIIPTTQTEWFNLQREIIKHEIKDPNFELVEKVKLGMLPKFKYLTNQKTSEIVGEGIITLNHKGLTYKGTKDGNEFSFFLPIDQIPTYGMCTDVSRFYTFYNKEFMEFYPEREIVEKFFLATEELHRLHDGKWQDFKFKK